MSFNGLNHIASGLQHITFTVPATPELLAATESLRESGIATVQAVDITAHAPAHDDDRAEDENMPALATEPEDSDEEENGPVLGAGTPRTPRNAHSSSSRSQATGRLMVGSLYSFIQTVPEPLQGNSQGIRPVRRTSALVPTSRARRRADAADSDAESVNSMPSLQTVSDSSEMEWILGKVLRREVKEVRRALGLKTFALVFLRKGSLNLGGGERLTIWTASQ